MINNATHEMHAKINDLISRNAILNFIIDNRNSGKTTQFKKRALIRNIKHGTITCFARRFEKEIKKFKKEFFNKKFFKVLEHDYPNRKFNKKDFKIKDNYAYYKDFRFAYFIYIKDAQADKGIDEDSIDTIVYDEFMTNDSRYNFYRGDEVKDFFDIFMTKKRKKADGTEAQVKIFMLGNRESYFNPYYTYFNLPYMNIEFTGIKTFRHGAIALLQLNTPVIEAKTDYDKKLQYLVKNTPLEKYWNGENAKALNMTFAKPSKNALIYACFDFGYCISLYTEKSKIFVVSGVRKDKTIFTKKPNTKYKHNYVISQRDKSLFDMMRKYYKLNQIEYADAICHDAFMKIIDYIGI